MRFNPHNLTGLETAAKSTEQQSLQLALRLRPTCAGFTFEGRVGFAMKEIWKPVLGFEGLYEISNLGKVRALYSGNHGAFKPGRIVADYPHQNGYLFVTLYRPLKVPEKGRGTVHKGYHRSIHSLVLEAFKGKRPKGKVARHLDGNKVNNSPDNLKWGTYAENAEDAKRHGTFVLGEKNGYSKMTNDQVLEARRLRDIGVACQTIANQFGVHWSNIWLIGKRKTWKHLPEASP